MPKDRFHHGDLPKALVQAATQAIREKGVERFSLRSVARSLEVDPAAAYRHFKDKRSLLTAVARGAFTALSQQSQAAMATQSDPGPRFMALGHAYLDFARDEPALFELVFGPTCPLEEAAPADGSPSPYALLTDAVEALRAAGLCHIPTRWAALNAWAQVHGLATLFANAAVPRADHPAAREAALSFVLAGLAGPLSVPSGPDDDE